MCIQRNWYTMFAVFLIAVEKSTLNIVIIDQ